VQRPRIAPRPRTTLIEFPPLTPSCRPPTGAVTQNRRPSTSHVRGQVAHRSTRRGRSHTVESHAREVAFTCGFPPCGAGSRGRSPRGRRRPRKSHAAWSCRAARSPGSDCETQLGTSSVLGGAAGRARLSAHPCAACRARRSPCIRTPCRRAPRSSPDGEEEPSEASVPAQQSPPGQAPRLPASHVDPCWPSRPAGPPAQGPRPAVGLSLREPGCPSPPSGCARMRTPCHPIADRCAVFVPSARLPRRRTAPTAGR
jgi:hypothetical protein